MVSSIAKGRAAHHEPDYIARAEARLAEPVRQVALPVAARAARGERPARSLDEEAARGRSRSSQAAAQGSSLP